MKVLAIEHTRRGYFIDAVCYLAAVLLLSGLLLFATPSGTRAGAAVATAAGLVAWSLIEYGMHRFILHRIAPFRRLHEEHHRRPQALLATPTLLSAAAILVGVSLPAILLGNLWIGCGATLGVTAGYLAFSVLHYAVHHTRLRSPWLSQRQRLHALHHRFPDRYYGVTLSLWDHVFNTAKPDGN
ncbi:MAG: sterol desaturase family protein [Gammaproteobacteria bacterium]|nr:sterol desaturase family protein [Gammaproteobacteria bacterium]